MSSALVVMEYMAMTSRVRKDLHIMPLTETQQIPTVLKIAGVVTKVTLLPIGSRGIQLGHSKGSRLLSCKMEGQIELCTKVCTIATELYQTSTNFTLEFIQEGGS